MDTQFGNAAHQVAATVACISIRRSLLAVAEKSCRSILFIDLKYAIESVMPCSALSSCMVWWTGKVSSERRDGMIVSLYKGKGTKAECSSCRQMSLLSAPGKAFANVFKRHLKTTCILFTAAYGVTDN